MPLSYGMAAILNNQQSLTGPWYCPLALKSNYTHLIVTCINYRELETRNTLRDVVLHKPLAAMIFVMSLLNVIF